MQNNVKKFCRFKKKYYLCSAENKRQYCHKTQNLKSMKRFNLRGNSANWDALRVSALNTKTEEQENRSEIPYGHKITVRVVDNYYRVYDKRVRQILHGEISTEDNAEIIARLTRKHRPDFILFHDGKVVGTANYHRKAWYRKMQEQPKLKTYNLDVLLRSQVSVDAYSLEDAKQKVYEAAENAKVLTDGNLEVISAEEFK